MQKVNMRILIFLCILILYALFLYSSVLSCKNENASRATVPQSVSRPIIDGDWWPIAGNPNLGRYSSEKQQPVNFAIWQASDGTWQLWSCIRDTNCGGHARLFYRWESKNIIEKNWQPRGIAMEADTTLGETVGGLQAPYVFKVSDTFYMIYGDWNRICLATSIDGKNFFREFNERGQPDLFSGPYNNTRDPMIIRDNGFYYCYYSGHTNSNGIVLENGEFMQKEYKSAVFCRTSIDLKHWSQPVMVAAGGIADRETNWFGGRSECPFVIKRKGYFYFFRNQVYGQKALNSQYASKDPFNFGVGDDSFRIGTLEIAAPEIVCNDGNYFIASLNPGLDGIRLAKLRWESTP